MSSETTSRVMSQQEGDPVFRFITPVSASSFEASLPRVENTRDVRSLTEGLDTLPDLRRRSQGAESYSPSNPSGSNPLSSSGEVRPYSSNILEELEEAQLRLNRHLSIQEDRIHGQERQIKDYIDERTTKYKTVSAVAHAANCVVVKPLNFLNYTLGWGVYAEPPESLMDQNRKAVAECEAEIAYRKSLIDKLEPSLRETGEKLAELKKLNAQLGEVTDGREGLLLRKAIQEKVVEVVGLLDKAGKIDSKELQADWANKMAGLSASLKTFVSQLDTTEVVLESTRKGLIITAGILVGGGAIVGAAGTLGGTIAVATSTGGFFTTGAVGTVTGIAASGVFIGAETASRGALYGENVLSVDYAKEKGMQLLGDTKDTILYVFGNKLAVGVLSQGGKFFTGLVSKIPFLNHSGKAAVSMSGATAQAQAVQQSVLSWTKAKIRKAAGNVFGGAAEGTLTELAPAMVDTEIQVRNGTIDPELWWNEIYHRVALAGVGAGVGRSMDKAVLSSSGTFNTISNSIFGEGRGTQLLQGFAKWGPLKGAGFTIEGIADLYSGRYAAGLKEGYFYYGEKALSQEEERQIVTTMIASRFTTAASAHTRYKAEVAHQAKVSGAAEAGSARISQLHANLGIADSNPHLLVASANENSVVARESNHLPLNAHTAHLGVDPEIGRRQVAHSLTQQASLSADKALGGVLNTKIIEPLKANLESILPASVVAPVLHKDREGLVSNLYNKARGVVASVSSHLGTNVPTSREYGENLGKLVKEFNNARRVTDTDGLTKKQVDHIEAEARKNPFGIDREVKVVKPLRPTSLGEIVGATSKGVGKFAYSFLRDLPILGSAIKSGEWLANTSPGVWTGKKLKGIKKFSVDNFPGFYNGAKHVPILKQAIAFTEGTIKIGAKSGYWLAENVAYVGGPIARHVVAPVGCIAGAWGVVSLFTPVASAYPPIGVFLLYTYAKGRVAVAGLNAVGDTVNGTGRLGGAIRRGVTNTVDRKTQAVDAGRVMSRFAEGRFLLGEVEVQRAAGREILTARQEVVLRAEVDNARQSFELLNRRSRWWTGNETKNLREHNGADGPKVDRILTEPEKQMLLTELDNSFRRAAQTDIRENVILVRRACNDAHGFRVNLADYASLLGTAFGNRVLSAERSRMHAEMLRNINAEIARLNNGKANRDTADKLRLAQQKKSLLESVDPVVGVKWENLTNLHSRIAPGTDALGRLRGLSDTARIARVDQLNKRSREIIIDFEQMAANRRSLQQMAADRLSLQREYINLVEEFRILNSYEDFKGFVDDQIREIGRANTRTNPTASPLSLPKVEILKTHLQNVLGLRESLGNDLRSGVAVADVVRARRQDGLSDNLIRHELEVILKDVELDVQIKRQEVEHFMSYGIGNLVLEIHPILARAKSSNPRESPRNIEEFVRAVLKPESTFKSREEYRTTLKRATDDFLESGGLKFDELYNLMAKANGRDNPQNKKETFRQSEERREARDQVETAFKQLLGDADPSGARIARVMDMVGQGLDVDARRFLPIRQQRDAIRGRIEEIERITSTFGLAPKEAEALIKSASIGDVDATSRILSDHDSRLSPIAMDRMRRLAEGIKSSRAVLQEFVVALRFGDATTNTKLQNFLRSLKFNAGMPDSVQAVDRIISGDAKIFEEMSTIYNYLMCVKHGYRPDIGLPEPKRGEKPAPDMISPAEASIVLDRLKSLLVKDSTLTTRVREALVIVENVTLPIAPMELRGDPVSH